MKYLILILLTSCIGKKTKETTITGESSLLNKDGFFSKNQIISSKLLP